MTTKDLIKNLRFCAGPNACGNCVYRERGCMDGLMEDAADAIERLNNERGWISVKERLPDCGQVVLCAIYGTDMIFTAEGETLADAIKRCRREAERHPRVEMGRLDEDGLWTEEVFGAPMICAPSFWMSMPEPPREEDSHE